MMRVGAATGCTALIALLALYACAAETVAQEESSSGEPDAGGPDAVRERPDAGGEVTPASPSKVPDGWVSYDDYESSCGFYVPSDRKYLPKGFEWESCEKQIGAAGAPGPAGMSCSRMVTDWDPAPIGQHVQGYNPANVGPDGKLRMLVRRFVKDAILEVIGDVDGRGVHQALLQTQKCLTFQPSLSGTHVIYGMLDDPKASGAGGAIGGRIDELRPRVYRPFGYLAGATLFPSFRAGDGVFVEDRGLDEVRSFDGGSIVSSLPNQADDLGASYTAYQFSGQDLFFEADSSSRVTIKSWTVGAGIKTLIGKDNDSTRSSIGFGTDGVDMVWLEASERVGTSQIYAKEETWTAKYTTDADVLAATRRRVRATTIEYGNVYKVGCGYAAVSASTDAPWGKGGVRIVRLSDGVSWEILDNSEAQRLEWNIDLPIAVTCDEVFVSGSTWRGTGSRHYEIMRIRIDSLGPGIPPT